MTDGPITSPDQIDGTRSTDGPVTSPDQVDAARARTFTADGPVTSPSQVDGPPSDAALIDPYPDVAPRGALPRTFDPIFDRYRGSIPIEYLRAIASRESDFDPKNRTGSARGLMQIINVVRTDYNERHGTHYTPDDLYDPAVSVAIRCWLIEFVIASYHRNHPRIPNLQVDWNNPRFVELCTFGQAAGFSEAGGVGRVARYLEHHGITDLTIDLVARAARAAGASHWLSEPAKVRWCKSAVALYYKERAFAEGARNARRARYGREGRTILRDGVPVVHVERVDLGDQRFAISPHEADVLTARIVRLLNARRS